MLTAFSVNKYIYIYIFTYKFNVAIATFKNLLNMAVLEEYLNKTDKEKVG